MACCSGSKHKPHFANDTARPQKTLVLKVNQNNNIATLQPLNQIKSKITLHIFKPCSRYVKSVAVLHHISILSIQNIRCVMKAKESRGAITVQIPTKDFHQLGSEEDVPSILIPLMVIFFLNNNNTAV